jgi:N-acetylglucosamine-6-phosphate deacetylase
MAVALVNGHVLLPEGLRDDVCVVIRDDRIAAVSSEAPADAERIDLDGGLLLPGFIDTQVNGGGGVLFNTAPTVEGIATMAAAHRRFGTTGMVPTLISDSLDVVAAAIEASDAAIEAGVPGILGRHIEGPFLNIERRGIHDATRIRRLDPEAIAILGSARHGRTVVTVAPECVHPGDIAALTRAGVIVAAAHSQADYDTVASAVGEGMRGITHLFNAMPPLVNRTPGVVGATLDIDALYAGLIVDGHHLHPATVRLAWRIKGPDRLMLVTDAMSITGSDEDHFILQGREIRRDGTRLVDEKGILAGSTLDMVSAVRNLMETTGAPLHHAVASATATPAAFLGLSGETGAIIPGLRADLILTDAKLGAIRRSWIAGRN